MNKIKLLSISILSLGLTACVTKDKPTIPPIAKTVPTESVLNTSDEVESPIEAVEEDDHIKVENSISKETNNGINVDKDLSEINSTLSERTIVHEQKDQLAGAKDSVANIDSVISGIDSISIDDIEIFTPTKAELKSMK